MTDLLTALAIVGTDKGGAPDSLGDARVDAVLAGSSKLPLEARVLLAAGARAVASFAGARTLQGVARPPLSEPDAQPACSAALDAVIAGQLPERDTRIVLEALAALSQRGLRLHHTRLGDAPLVQDALVQRAFAAVAGARGRWLGAVHPACAWLLEAPAPTLAGLEALFSEAKASARAALLREARGLDAAAARGWVEAAWESEKADGRASLLGALETGLSPADEPLLARALGERSQGVREQSASLLSRLPESAYVARQVARADQAFSLGVENGAPVLAIAFPQKFEKEDARDALVPSANAGTTARAGWSRALVAALPPRYWNDRFKTTPQALVAAGAQASGVLDGFVAAAALHRDPAWAAALVRWVREQPAKERQPESPLVRDVLLPALGALPPPLASAEVEAWLVAETGSPLAWQLLGEVPQWRPSLSRAYLAARGGTSGAWDSLLSHAAYALDVSSFDEALALHAPVPGSPWQLAALHRFQELVRLRLTIALEPRALEPRARREESAQ